MSTASNQSRGYHRRLDSFRSDEQTSRGHSPVRQFAPSLNDAYIYSLRAAYLHYLLQPRAKRRQHVPAPASMQRIGSAAGDLIKDLSMVKDNKSTRLPHNFLADFEKRVANILTNVDKRPEYSDAVIKRSFALFYNQITEQSRRKGLDTDRRVEDLVLIFFSSATKELQQGKAPGDDAWKLMVDRHVALFVRLIQTTLQESRNWARDRPELTAKLATLEKKLLKHDQDLAAASQTGGGGTTIEVLVERSYKVADMPMVMLVGRMFGFTSTMLQSDIDKNRPIWTEKAALADLKTYQTNLELNSKKTLRNEDFDTTEAYTAWKKSEVSALPQMMLSIVQSNPELAKSTPGGQPDLTYISSNGRPPPPVDSGSTDTIRKVLDSEDSSLYSFDQPVDMSGLSLNDGSSDRSDDSGSSYTFIPPNSRAHFKLVLSQALMYDLQEQHQQNGGPSSEDAPIKIFSKKTAELLHEIVLRWRIPSFSRNILLLDVTKDKYRDQEIDLDALIAVFEHIEEATGDKNSPSNNSMMWTMSDFALKGQILSALHESLLRDLYVIMQYCYQNSPPSVGKVMHVLMIYIYEDPQFSEPTQEAKRFAIQLEKGLQEKAMEVYKDFVEKHIPERPDEWEFHNVIQLGKAVTGLADRLRKRYRKNPEIMGVNPTEVFIIEVLPKFAEDARTLVIRTIEIQQDKGQEIQTDDGIDLYKELVNFRKFHEQRLRQIPFPFPIEAVLSDFVWRIVKAADETLVAWVENAVKQDNFEVRVADQNREATEEERHSISAMDMYGFLNQSVQSIIELNWEDELQYAKFMTALSRTIGMAVAKYCDLVEQRFSKEMDRLSPEQEAALTKSRQERWMQLAKDAWSNKEKVEPFNFYPESFVKLNNIEWALEQLDELQRKINVDACAAVIARNTPAAAKRQRKVNNYVFTIKIVEAENLKACDMNGLSDPYVVLNDEYQKRLVKTRIIYGNLNPRWDETVEITTQGPLNIIATIWDWDTLGDHDYVGRTQLKLDPSHFSDFVPREYPLELDTQGFLLLRIGMEGEQDDIQFYFGKAFRTLKRTERDMTRIITDKLSAYIQHCLSRNGLRSLLSTGYSMASVSSLFARNRQSATTSQAATDADIDNALAPLFTYFDDNFYIMRRTLIHTAMIKVMTRLWKEVLATIEALLIPPLSDKPSAQKPLTPHEVDVVFKWLDFLFSFFHGGVDPDTQQPLGVPQEVLKSPRYFDVRNLAFFYFESTDNLIRESERIASQSAARQAASRTNRLSAPASMHAFGGAAGLVGVPSVRRSKSIMNSRNLGTIRKAKEEKRKEIQAEPTDDMILRILRMRPEAERYLKDRSRQKERLAAVAAAEKIVTQSLAQGSNRIQGSRR